MFYHTYIYINVGFYSLKNIPAKKEREKMCTNVLNSGNVFLFLCRRSFHTAIADLSVFLSSRINNFYWWKYILCVLLFSVCHVSLLLLILTKRLLLMDVELLYDLHIWICICDYLRSSVRCISWPIQIVKSKSWTFFRCQNLCWAVSIKRTWTVCVSECVCVWEREVSNPDLQIKMATKPIIMHCTFGGAVYSN